MTTNYIVSRSKFEAIIRLNQSMEDLLGIPLRNIYTTPTVWKSVLRDQVLRELSGNKQTGDTAEYRAERDNVFVLVGVPWLRWHISEGNTVLKISGPE